MKDRLYYENAYIKEFTAHVEETGADSNGRFYVILDQTAFYPTGGGQPYDIGEIEGIRVIDVEEVDGRVLHYVETAFPDHLKQVRGRIDWNRRFDHMQQHLGQHILSAAFVEQLDAKTVGFHLGKESVTIDIDITSVTDDMIHNVENLANEIVTDNRSVVTKFVDQEELASYPLRKLPTVQENIRLVIVPNFDYNPCGGTHPTSTSEVGLIKILGWERYKNSIRVEFVCGIRALKRFHTEHSIIRQLKQQLTASEPELIDKVDRLLQEKRELEKTVQQFQGKMLELEAEELIHNGKQVGHSVIIAKAFHHRSIQELQKLVQETVSRKDNAVLLFVTSNDKVQLVFGRGKEAEGDMNQILKATLAKIDGKGGGTPTSAQGGGLTIVPPEELLQVALDLYFYSINTHA